MGSFLFQVDAARQADAAWSRDEVSGHYFGTDLVPLFLRAPAMSVYSKVDFVINHCLCVWLVYFILSQSKPAIDEMRGPSPWLVPSASLNGFPLDRWTISSLDNSPAQPQTPKSEPSVLGCIDADFSDQACLKALSEI